MFLKNYYGKSVTIIMAKLSQHPQAYIQGIGTPFSKHCQIQHFLYYVPVHEKPNIF